MGKRKPYWYPDPTNHEYCDRIRKDYSEKGAEDKSDEEIIEEYAEGREYSVLWDHIGDAYDDYKPLADNFLKSIELLKKCEKVLVTKSNDRSELNELLFNIQYHLEQVGEK